MRFFTVTIVASIVAAASAVEYPFKPNGPCIQGCLDTVGKEMSPNFSMDPNSPYFMESLGYAHNRGTPSYTNFMAKTGMCNSKCPKEEQDLYSQQYQAKSDWFAANKSGGASATGSASVPAKTSAPASKPTGAASVVVASTGLIGAAAIGAAVLLF